MKLLLSNGVEDRSLENHLMPLVNSPLVDDILVVRNKPGPPIAKTRYFTPPAWALRSSILKTLYRLFILVRLSLSEKPDIVHGYLLFPDGLNAFIAGKLTSRRVGVSLIAGPVELFLTGNSPTGKFCYTDPFPPVSGLGVFFRFVLQHVDYITVSGSYTKRVLADSGIREDSITIVPHIVDERFTPKNTEKEYDLVFIGRLVDVKHLDSLIRTINVVKTDIAGIRVAILGTGDRRNELENMAQQLGLQDNIFFLGYTDAPWTYFNAAKCSILLSEREGFPYSVVESLSCGVPVIATRCGDIIDVVQHEHNGLFVKSYKDIDDIAQNITSLLGDPETLARMSENALTSIQHLTLASVISKWEGILKRP